MYQYFLTPLENTLVHWRINRNKLLWCRDTRSSFRDVLPVLNVLTDDEEVGFDEAFNDLTVPLLTWRQLPGNRHRLEGQKEEKVFKSILWLEDINTREGWRLKFSYHVKKVDSSFQGASRSRARGVLSFLQHSPPVACTVLLTLSSCCRGLRSQEQKRKQRETILTTQTWPKSHLPASSHFTTNMWLVKDPNPISKKLGTNAKNCRSVMEVHQQQWLLTYLYWCWFVIVDHCTVLKSCWSRRENISSKSLDNIRHGLNIYTLMQYIFYQYVCSYIYKINIYT